MKTCDIDGCGKPARSSKAAWCPMHYHRWYRHGSTDKVATGVKSEKPKGSAVYVMASDAQREHPMAMPCGKIYVHRMVLYDKIGPGPHACHWCDAVVDWLPKGTPGELNPDHIDGDTHNNEPDNLVASCRTCNILRGQQKRAERLRAAGFWSNNDTVGKLKKGRRAPVEPIPD